MFKKKLKVEIEIGDRSRLYYPEIGDNLERDEADRFAIEIKKLSNMEKMRSIKIEDGNVRNDEDLLFRSTIGAFINPPIVNGERDLTLDDIINEQQFYMVLQGLYIEALKFNAPKMDKKKL